jgi:hypothetical protein
MGRVRDRGIFSVRPMGKVRVSFTVTGTVYVRPRARTRVSVLVVLMFV